MNFCLFGFNLQYETGALHTFSLNHRCFYKLTL